MDARSPIEPGTVGHDFNKNERSHGHLAISDDTLHDNPARRDYDAKRQRFLTDRGFRVVRFKNREVLEQPDMVLTAIDGHFDAK